MGASQSKGLQADPKTYATATDNDDSATWRQYDYIIVGGGTAGCVLAARLSEDSSNKVLLLEAGKSHTDQSALLTRIPLGFSKIWGTPLDWGYQTTPQPGLDGRQLRWVRGKVLGGSSAVNALIHQYASPDDYDRWAAEGATGWGWEDLKPYFHKAEKYHSIPAHVDINASQHGKNGPLPLSFSRQTPIIDRVNDACHALGVPKIADSNTERGSLGITPFAGILEERGRRCSTAAAYLTSDVLARANLTVAIGVTVEKVLFAPKGEADTGPPRAVGVQLATGPQAQRFRVAAAREVILAAGALATPHLLLLSGLGPADELRATGVDVVADLPHVGRNLSDHVNCGPMVFRVKDAAHSWDHINETLSAAHAVARWFVAGKGPMASMLATSGAFVRTSDTSIFPEGPDAEPAVADRTTGPRSPDLELLWFPLSVFGVTPGAKRPSTRPGMTLSAVVLQPESVGRITLASSSAWDMPVIDPNYFSAEHDLDVLVRGARFLLRIVRTEPLASALDRAPTPGQDGADSPWWPGDADPDTVTDEALEAWIRRKAVSTFHPTSTARIGASAETGVVDASLRVHGVAGLRVVDASVFPTQLSGHPAAAVIAIAERAADLVKREAPTK